MLNFIYYPVSGILWFWHKVFGFVLGADSGFAWALSVIFLVFTLRALLFKPFVSQVRSMRKMQEFQPQIKKLQEKYKNDRQRLAEEMQKLQKEHGVNPLGGCLPVLVQLPVFIGLFHVLRGFRLDYAYNYVFSYADIVSFDNATLFGVRLSQAISGDLSAIGSFSLNFGDFKPEVIPVALPLMIIASVATHFTARISLQHQSPAAAAQPQAAIMGRLTMWVFPLGVLVFGVLFPIAILLYWLSNNSWTLTQQWYVYGKIAAEEEEQRALAKEQRDNLAPKPGQKPQVGQKPRRDGKGQTPGEDAPETVGTAEALETADVAETASARTETSAETATTSARKGSGRAAPGKVGSPAGPKNGAGKNGAGQKNGAGKNGAGKNGQKNGQPVGSGRPGKKKPR